MNIKIYDLMVTNVLTVEPHHTVERLRRIMSGNQISALPVVGHDGGVVGIVTATDLAKQQKEHTPASHFMSERVYTIPQYNDVHVAARLMRNHHVHHVVVTHEKRIVGILSAFDLLRLVEDHRFTMKAAPQGAKNKGHRAGASDPKNSGEKNEYGK